MCGKFRSGTPTRQRRVDGLSECRIPFPAALVMATYLSFRGRDLRLMDIAKNVVERFMSYVSRGYLSNPMLATGLEDCERGHTRCERAALRAPNHPAGKEAGDK